VLQSNQAVENQASHPEQTSTRPINIRRTTAGMLAAAGLLIAPLANAAFFTPGQFDVSPTGAASYSVPVAVPPGTAGMVPSLALAYNSQGGNGLLGVGWSLSGLSAITRCPRTLAQDNTRSGINYDANDKYCLDGQRLIAISGTYGANGTEYRTEREGYSKIVSYGSNGYGPTNFKVWTKSGQIMEFGNTQDSAIEAQGKSALRVWAVNKISDTKGNYLTITYTEDTPNGQYYPSRIDYTGNAAAGLATYNSVRFTYATRPDIIPAIYVGGSLTSITQRLTNVQTYAKVSGVDTMVKDYQLTYANSSAPNNASRVTQIKECSGTAGDCLQPTALEWQLASGNGGLVAGSGWTSYGNKTGMGDFNGDGYADVVYETITSNPYDGSYGSYTHRYYVAYSNGAGLNAPVTLGSAWTVYCGNSACSTPANVKTAQPGVVGDLNGDGKDDLYGVAANSGASTWMGGGSGLTAGSGWTLYGNKTGMGDFNGDGYADVAYETITSNPYDGSYGSYTHRYYVAYSNGAGLNAPVTLGSAWTVFCGNSGCSSPVNARPAQPGLVGDLNGDGKDDLYGVAANSGASTWMGGGSGLTAGSGWTAYANKVGMGDFNGDGYADVAYAVSTYDPNYGSHGAYTHQYYVAYSNGGSLGTGGVLGSSWWLACPSSCSSVSVAATGLVGDLNGDGKDDLYGVESYSGASTWMASSPTSDLLNKVTTGLGAETVITYKAIADTSVYTKETTGVYPVRDLNTSVPLYVVSSVSSSTGVSGSLYVSNYSYVGGKSHLTGGGFLGFRQTVSTDAQTGIKSTTTYRQDYPYQGLPSSAEKRTSGGTLLNSVTNTWAFDTNPAWGAQYHAPQLGQSVESSYELTGALISTVTTCNTYDGYGNPTYIGVWTAGITCASPPAKTGLYVKETTNTYTNDTANWFLGRLTGATVTSTTP